MGDIGYVSVLSMIIINNFGICCAYFRIFGENMQNIFQAFVSPDSYWVTNWHNYLYVLLIFIIMGLLLFFESLESLAQVSFLGVIGIFVFMIGLFTIYFYKLAHGYLPVFHGKQFLPSGPFLDLLTSLPTVFLAFSFQFNVFPIYYTLKERKQSPMTKATIIGISMCLFFYLCTGILGFLLYQYKLTDTILQMLLIDMQIYKDVDSFLKLLLIISNIGFLSCCTTGIPVMFFGLKENLFGLITFSKQQWRKFYPKSKVIMPQGNTQCDLNPIEEKINFSDETKNEKQEDLINNSVSMNSSRISDEQSTNSLNKKRQTIQFQTKVHSDEPKEKEMIEFEKDNESSIKSTPLPTTLEREKKKTSIDEDQLTTKVKIIIIFAMYGCIGIVTLIIPQVKTIFNIVGSTAANATSFIIPSLIIIMLVRDKKIESSLILPIILLVIGIIILIGCLTGEIINAAK